MIHKLQHTGVEMANINSIVQQNATKYWDVERGEWRYPKNVPIQHLDPSWAQFQADSPNDYCTHVGALTERVFNFAEATFPNRTDVSMYLKLYSEIGEMIESDGDESEIADVFIMLLDYAKRKKVDITTAVMKKLAVNYGRSWVVDSNGVARHEK